MEMGNTSFQNTRRPRTKMLLKGYQGIDNSAFTTHFHEVKVMGSSLMLIVAQELGEPVFVRIP